MVGEVPSYCDKHLVKLIMHGGGSLGCEVVLIAIGYIHDNPPSVDRKWK